MPHRALSGPSASDRKTLSLICSHNPSSPGLKSLFLASLLLCLAAPAALAAMTNQIDEFNVLSYGATGNGVTDDTAAFTAAISAAKSGNHCGVYVPMGRYVISSTLTLNGLELLGNLSDGWPADNFPLPTLLIRQYTAPAIILTNGASLSGFAIIYDQHTPVTTNAPAISLQGNAPALERLRIQNPYDAITTPNIDQPGRARMSDILIVQPAHTGIQISKAYDFVQFKHIEVICPGAMSTGPAFDFGRVDEGCYTGLVASNCAVGLQFYFDTASGGGLYTGSFTACSFVNCSNAVSAIGDHKIKITASDFTSSGPGMTINGTNAEITLTGDSWQVASGPAVQVTQAANVIVESCIFSRPAPIATPLVQLNNATTVTVDACQFLPGSTGLELDSLLYRAIITGNSFEQGGIVNLMTSARQIIAGNILNLTIAAVGNSQGLTLTWPAWPPNAPLYSAPALSSSPTWQPVNGTPQSNNGTLTLNLPLTNSQVFFRLDPP